MKIADVVDEFQPHFFWCLNASYPTSTKKQVHDMFPIIFVLAVRSISAVSALRWSGAGPGTERACRMILT